MNLKGHEPLGDVVRGLENYLQARRKPLPPGAARVTPTQYLQMVLLLLQQIQECDVCTMKGVHDHG